MWGAFRNHSWDIYLFQSLQNQLNMNISIHETEMEEQHLLRAWSVEKSKTTGKGSFVTSLVWTSAFFTRLSASPELVSKVSWNHLERQWHPTLVLLPGNSHGQRSLVGCGAMGSLRVGHDWATSLSLFTLMHWRRTWQPTPVFLPGESQGQGSLVGCSPRGLEESDTTEATQQQQQQQIIYPWERRLG